jgi:hypothetical protein
MYSLYIIGTKSGEPLKIGVTTDIQGRIRSLQTSHPKKLRLLKSWTLSIESVYRIETLSHAMLGILRLNGEWFGCSLDEAIKEIHKIMKNTKNGKELDYYTKHAPSPIKSKSAQIGARISADNKKAKAAEGIAKIKDRWPLPSKEWPTDVLLDEADVSFNTAKAHLGPRPIAQYNYQAAQKRKARKLQRDDLNGQERIRSREIDRELRHAKR